MMPNDHLSLEDVIKRAFLELMEEQPFSTIRVTAIVKRSHVSHQTFYRLFPNKYELAVSVFANQLSSAVTVSGKNATFREVMMILLTIMRNNAKIYSNLLCDSEGSKLMPDILSQISSAWTGFPPAWASSIINSQSLIGWANNRFQGSIEEVYTKFVYYLPAYELFTPEEMEERIKIYENLRSSDFISRRHPFVHNQ